MRKLLGIGAVVLGFVGVLLCATAVGIGCWAVMTTTARLDRVAARLELGFSEVDVQLARVELRLKAVCTDLITVREAAETIAARSPNLPVVRAEVELLHDRLVAAFDRADTLGDTIRSGAAGLRTAADIVDQFHVDPEATVRVRTAADRIEGAAESLNSLRARIDDSKSARAVQLTRELATLARAATADSERFAEGLAAVRQEIASLCARTAEWRDYVVSWIYVVGTAGTLILSWGGLGQLGLIGWGRRQLSRIPDFQIP